MNIQCEDRERIFRDGSAEQWAALERHAAACPACAEELRGWKRLSAAAAELRDYRESPALWSRLDTSLQEQQSAAAGRRKLERFFDFWQSGSYAWQFALVGALVVVLAVTGGDQYIPGSPKPSKAMNNLLSQAPSKRSSAPNANIWPQST